MHEGEKLFFQRRFPQAGIFADGSNGLIHFLLEEMQRDVFLGPEIIEDSTFGNPSLARNCFGRCGVETLGLKETQGGGHDSPPNRRFVLGPPPHRTLERGCSARLSLRCRFLLCGHSTIREYAHSIYEYTHELVNCLRTICYVAPDCNTLLVFRLDEPSKRGERATKYLHYQVRAARPSESLALVCFPFFKSEAT